MSPIFNIFYLLLFKQIAQIKAIDGLNVASKCQSGLREDNTNYIYCARQNLTSVPNFFQFGAGISNVLYDELVLSDNLIPELTKNTFPSSLKVRKLYLDLNPIEKIDKPSFDYLRNYLEELYFDLKLSDNNNFQNEYEENYEDAESTQIDDALLFEQSVLQSCFNLKLLSIKNYRWTRLRDLKFFRMNKLEILQLSKLKLKQIEQDAFAGLENTLIELNLDSNQLESISHDSIEKLKRLRKLNLSQNRIRQLNPNTFFRFGSTLNYLDLSYNLLANIDESAFNGPIQYGLKYLYLQNNELKWQHFLIILNNLHLLTELNIDFNKLFINNNNNKNSNQDAIMMNKYFNKTNLSTFIYLNLNSLSMQGNGLTDKSLEQLESSSSFRFVNLNKLNLARNKLTQTPEEFFSKLNMTWLKSLNLDRNPFDVEKFNFKTFSGLEKSLQSLSMSNAGIDIFASNFIQSINVLEVLQSLKLNNNRAVSNDNHEKLNLKSLSAIELQNNNIRKLPAYLCQLESLRDLDLSTNKLTNFDLNCLLFKYKNNYYESTALNRLNLNNNPLKCDCNMRQLKIWLMRNYEQDFLEYIKWKCNEPFEMSERLLTMTNLDELKCTEETSVKSTPTTSTLSSTTPTTTSKTFINKINFNEKTERPFTLKLNEETKKPTPETQILNYENSYYTLIMSISFGISIFCLILLISFYFLYIRKQQQYEYNKNNSSLLSDYLTYKPSFMKNTNNTGLLTTLPKNSKLQIFSTTSSPSGCSSSSTTSSGGTCSLLFNSKTKSFDLIEMYSNSSNNNNNSNDEFQLFQQTGEPSKPSDYNHLNNLFISNRTNTIKNANPVTSSRIIPIEFCSDYNNLNYDDSSIFSVAAAVALETTPRQIIQNSNCDNHIYHEINNNNTCFSQFNNFSNNNMNINNQNSNQNFTGLFV